MNKRRAYIFPVLAVLIASILSLVLLEIFFWFFLHNKWQRREPIPALDWVVLTPEGRRLKRNLKLTYRSMISGKEVEIRTNSLGFRGREISLSKNPGTLRILVLGDSITLSAFLSEEETYPVVLEKMLSERWQRRVEVINAGVYDVGLKEELGILKEAGLKLKPDLVLLGFYLNDSRPPWGFENEYYRLPAWLIRTSKTIEQYSYFYKFLWKRFLVRHFLGKNMAQRFDWQKQYLLGKWQTERSAFQRLVKSAYLDWGSAWSEDSWKGLYKGLDELLSLSKSHQFQLYIVVFPVAVQVKSEVADEFPQEKMKQYCEARQLPCLDLLPLFREHKEEEIFFDHCHLTARGQELVAGAIADFLEGR